MRTARRAWWSSLRLWFGMVRANRPWRFPLRLVDVLVAPLAVGVYSIVANNILGLASHLS